MNKKPLIIISGPTAAGKTELSLNLAEKIHGSVISADSMQVYRGFDIGTAKITREEMRGIPHYLIDELDPDEEFNVYEFQHCARKYIGQILSEGRIPIIVGGTGFYIQSVLYDIDFSEEHTDLGYRHELEETAGEKGPEYLHQMLQQIDPVYAQSVHANNVKRVIRALEYYRETGQPLSEHNASQMTRESPWQYAYFVLNRKRSVIYDRINLRVDRMIQEGLVEEVRRLLAQGVSPDALSMQGIGYKEILLYLNGEMSLEDAVSLLKQNTRHYAKRQITWFKREKDVIWMNYEDYENTQQMESEMLQILKEKKIVPLS